MDIDPNFYFTYWCLGFAYWQKGMLEEAVAAYERAVELDPEDLQRESRPRNRLCRLRATKPVHRQILEELEEKARREYVPPLALAMAHMAVGDLDGTFAWLDKMYEERDPWLIFMNEHPRYDRLRGDPRWHELMRKIGFTEAQIDAANALAGKRG